MKKYNNNNSNQHNTKNKSKRLLFILFCLIIVLISFWSCDDFVEVDLPNSQLTSNGVFEEKSTADAAMINIYSKIREVGLLTGTSSGLSLVLGNYADELDFYGNSQNGAVAFYNNSLLASNPDVNGLWNASYNQIYEANAVIQGVENAVNLPSSSRTQLKGEALFVRALIHFYLVNLFNDIPYITTTNYQENSNVSRQSFNEVLSLIKSDLQEAIQLLPSEYISANRLRPNKFTAHALLARVNLYLGQWLEASNQASIVIDNTSLYVYEQDLDKIFLKESTATIWQLAPGFVGGNTLESNTFNFTIGPPPLSALTTSFMASFTPNDLRKTHWTRAITDGTTTWYHPFKYKFSDTASSVEHSIIFRLPEMHLIRAEARAYLGNLSGAKEDVNIIRNTAGLANTTAISGEQVLAAILIERQLEFFTEFGHRFFDLKRTDNIQSVLSLEKPGWDTHDVLFPIPEIEISLNSNLLPQNPGY